MDVASKIKLVKEVGEEIITEEELKKLFEVKHNPIAYDGFEPSGKMHIAQGILRSINVNKMTKAGIKFKMLVADWHAWANNKMGGDLDKIKITGEYFIEIWKSTGMDLKNVEFVWASDLISSKEYWKTVIQISRLNTVKRIVRTSQIMGRSESDVLQASQIIYPCMQAADIFHLKADIVQLGMDQRKVNVLAREIGPKLGFWKPIIVSHHMLMGLHEPLKEGTREEKLAALKMSKSRPQTSIFMTDSTAEVDKKIKSAFCPEKQLDGNPIIEYCKYMLFEKFDSLKVSRPEKFGGDLDIGSFSELTKIYSEGKLHPADLKHSVATHLNILLEPVRSHFKKNSRARKLLEQVESFDVTR